MSVGSYSSCSRRSVGSRNSHQGSQKSENAPKLEELRNLLIKEQIREKFELEVEKMKIEIEEMKLNMKREMEQTMLEFEERKRELESKERRAMLELEDEFKVQKKVRQSDVLESELERPHQHNRILSQNKVTLNGFGVSHADIRFSASSQDVIQLLNLPEVHLDKFNGDILEFKNWEKGFKILVEDVTQNPARRFYYLTQFTKGEPNDLISCFSFEPTDENYQKAKKLLCQHYDNPKKLFAAYIKKLESWNLNDNNLGAFSSLLKNFKSSMARVGRLNYLEGPVYLPMLVKKFSLQIQSVWLNKVIKFEREGTEASLQEFIEFVDEQLELRNHLYTKERTKILIMLKIIETSTHKIIR